MHRTRIGLEAALLGALSILHLGCAGPPRVVHAPATTEAVTTPAPSRDPVEPAPELAGAGGILAPHVVRDAKDPNLIVVSLEWNGDDALELTRGRASSHCGVDDWRVTLVADDGSTYLSTPLSPLHLCYQVIVFEHVYTFEPGRPLAVASFHTQHLIPRDGAGPFAPGRYRVFVQGTFGSASSMQAEGTVTL